MEYIDIFDENNNPIGIKKEKDKAHEDGNFHRTAHVWIINDKNELLLQKRSATKKTHPNCWDISGAGHIRTGESVIDGAIRELKEELGIEAKDKDLQNVATIKSTKNPKNMEFQYVYLLKCNKKIAEYIFEDNEVSEVKYVHFEELEKMVKERTEGLLIHEEEFKKLFEYIRKNCDVQIKEIDKTEVTIETYNNIVKEYVEYYNSKDLKGNVQFQREIDYLTSQLHENAIILDAGTAIGDYPRYLTEKCDKNFNVIGIDTSENMLKQAIKNAPKAKFELMDIRNIKFNRNSFDAIICFATLIHVNDKTCLNVLDKFSELLKDNGIVAINVMECTNEEKEIFIKEPFNPKYNTYFNRYSKQFFIDYFTDNNYTIEKIYDNKMFDEEAVGEDLTGTNEFTIIAKKNK